MRRLKIKVAKQIFATIMICCLLCLSARAAEYRTAPTLNKGAKWRIGYYEGGEYMSYQKTLMAVIAGLMDTGWIEKAEIPPQEGIQTKNLWNWLAAQAKSSYLEFVADAHYSINWDKPLREKTASDIITRLNEKKDIDLMFAMGTWAGQDLANNRHHTPTLVMSCSDAVASNIIKSVDDSGYDHVHAWTDPLRHERQIWAFHNIIKFKKLGVAYQDTVAGRSYAAIEKIEKAAAKHGFEIIRCHTADARPDIKQFEDSVRKCFQELVKTADAVYVTQQAGVNKTTVPELVELCNARRIPTFSQAGEEEVKQGFLMTIALADDRYPGDFHVMTLAKILNGAKPRELPQYFGGPYKWHFNFETAKKIGLDISKLNMEADYITLPDFLPDNASP